MRIGIFTTNYPTITGPGGIGTYTRHLAQGLAVLGHTVHVLVPGDAKTTLLDDTINVHIINTQYIRVLDRLIPGAGSCIRVGAALRRLVARHQIDIVECPNWTGHGALYSWRRPTPLVVRMYTSTQESVRIDGLTENREMRWDLRRERWIVEAADTLVTHSRAHRSEMANELAIDPLRIRLVPLSVPVDRDFQRPPRREGDFKVVYLGRMEKRKGTIDLLHAVPAVLEAVPQATFVLIGADRPHCPGGRTHARYLQDEFPPEIRRRITLFGELSDAEIDRQLQSADVFVAPSLYESFGLIFLEAMRWGTPVVGTKAGGIPEIVEDGVSGVLVPPGSPAQLAEAIVGLLQDEDRRHRLGEAGRRRAEGSFSVMSMAQQMSALYEDTIRSWGSAAAVAKRETLAGILARNQKPSTEVRGR